MSHIQLRVHRKVEKHLALGTVWEVQFIDEDFHIDLNQELYERMSRAYKGWGVEERNMTDVDEENLKRNKILVSEQSLLEES